MEIVALVLKVLMITAYSIAGVFFVLAIKDLLKKDNADNDKR